VLLSIGISDNMDVKKVLMDNIMDDIKKSTEEGLLSLSLLQSRGIKYTDADISTIISNYENLLRVASKLDVYYKVLSPDESPIKEYGEICIMKERYRSSINRVFRKLRDAGSA
jgi:formyltetrahydrofolate hydrolase